MSFNKNWINLIMKCISLVSYSVIINGTAYGNITPTRGLRQGDPISPYSFLLCAEGFSALIHDAAKNNQLQGIGICRGLQKSLTFSLQITASCSVRPMVMSAIN